MHFHGDIVILTFPIFNPLLNKKNTVNCFEKKKNTRKLFHLLRFRTFTTGATGGNCQNVQFFNWPLGADSNFELSSSFGLYANVFFDLTYLDYYET